MNEFNAALQEVWKKYKKPTLNFSFQIYDANVNESQYYRNGHSLIILGLLEDHKHAVCGDILEENKQ